VHLKSDRRNCCGHRDKVFLVFSTCGEHTKEPRAVIDTGLGYYGRRLLRLKRLVASSKLHLGHFIALGFDRRIVGLFGKFDPLPRDHRQDFAV
jgi:hypothetical protein